MEGRRDMQTDLLMIFSVLLRDLGTNACLVCYYAFFAHIWYEVPVRPKRAAVCVVFAFLTHVVTHYLLGMAVPAFLLTGIMLWSVARLLWQPLGGLRFWICFAFCLISEYVWEFIYAFSAMRLYPDPTMFSMERAEVYAFAPAFTPVIILLFAVTLGIPLLIFNAIRKLRSKKEHPRGSRIYLLRLVVLFLLVFVLMALFAYNGDHLMRQKDPMENVSDTLLRNASFILVYALAIVLLIFYFWQNIQQYRLYLNNQSLKDKNDAYQRVLDGTREFRHNISNMLYGFEGVILNGDADAIRRYYEEMARRCLLTNNENADALNHIKDPSLTALLLRKIDFATEQQIPLYLNADPNFAFNGLPSTRLVEILGVLIDNAVEAAAKAHAPRVNVTLARAPGYDEILISNTYAEGADLSFLAGDAVSSKPGHRATGLASVRKALQRYPNVCFNQYPQGRYIETSLRDYKIAAR